MFTVDLVKLNNRAHAQINRIMAIKCCGCDKNAIRMINSLIDVSGRVVADAEKHAREATGRRSQSGVFEDWENMSLFSSKPNIVVSGWYNPDRLKDAYELRARNFIHCANLILDCFETRKCFNLHSYAAEFFDREFANGCCADFITQQHEVDIIDFNRPKEEP